MSAERDAEFEAFVAYAGPRLLTLAWLLCGDPTIARRWTGQVLERLYLRWGSRRRGEEQADARSALLRLHREHEGRRTGGRASGVASGRVARAHDSDRESDRTVLMAALAELAPRERQAVVMQCYLSLPTRAAAQAMGVRPATATGALSHGLARLRGLLGTAGQSAPEDEVVALVDRVAMQAPAAPIATEEVTQAARVTRRRDRRRRAGLVAAALAALAMVAWLVPQAERDDRETAEAEMVDDAQDSAEEGGAPRDSPGRHEATFLAVGAGERYAGALGDDGSAAAIAPLPADPRGYGPPPEVDSVSPQLVFEMGDRLITGEELALIPGVVERVPDRPELVLAFLPQRSVQADRVDVLSTLLFETDLGPRWAGRPPPTRHQLEGGARLAVSLDPDLDVWAAACGTEATALGRVGDATPGSLRCASRDDPAAPLRHYAVVVLPTRLAEQATAFPAPEGRAAGDEAVVVGRPQVLPLDEERALWAVSWSAANEPSGPEVSRAPFTVDLDARGTRDDGP